VNVLMVTWDGGGNVPSFLGLGLELLRRGHRVRCLGPQGIQTAVTRTGMVFQALQYGAVFDPRVPLPLEQSQQAQGAVFFDDGYMADLQSEVERERPDVIVIDCFLVSAQAAVEVMGLPFVILVHTLPGWLLPFWDQVLLLPTNAMRERSGLSTVASTVELWNRAKRTLVASTPLLDNPAPDRDLLPSLQYVGPIFEPDSEEDAVGIELDTSEPLVLVAFSTTSMKQEELLARITDALRTMPVRAIVTTGPAVDAAMLKSAPNVRVHHWIRHAAVLPHASLVITHAGHSTVTKALSYGVPLLCLPLGRDQGFIAERVHDIRVGRTMPSDAAPHAVTAAIASLLHHPSYRAAAQHVAETIRAAGPGEQNAADALEHIGRYHA
jgi:MGT family glycosyltransferase